MKNKIAVLQQFLSSLPTTLRSQAELTPELLERLRTAGDRLQDAERPEEWKQWLEPLTKLVEGNSSFDEAIAAIQSALGNLNQDELRAWYERSLRRH